MIEADLMKLQLLNTTTKVQLLEEQVTLLNSSLYTFQTKNDLLGSVVKIRESQIEVEKELNRRLSADLRREKRRSRTSNMIIAGTAVLLGYTLISR